MNAQGFDRVDLADGVRLWVLPDRRFKSVQIMAFLHRPLDDRATVTAMLPAVLRRGCQRLPTMARIAAFLENLYGASFGASVFKSGEQHVLTFFVEVLNDRFVPRGKGPLGRAVDFLFRVMARPIRQGRGLKKDYVEGEKENLRRLIEGLVNDRAAYAWERCVGIMCEGEPFARYEFGRLEDIPPVTPGGLAEFHAEVLRTAPVEFFVSGDVDTGRIERLFRRRMRFGRRKVAPPPATVIRTARAEPREVVERMEVEQGNLVLGCRTGATWTDPGILDLSFANAVLGGFPHSRLFRIVREQEGLAYGTSSSLDPAKGLVMITAGIDPSKYADARRVILEQLDSLRQGDLSDEEMDKTRSSLVNRIRSREDSMSSRISFFHEVVTCGRTFTSGEMIEGYRAVTKEAVAKAARRIGLDTVYFLTQPS